MNAAPYHAADGDSFGRFVRHCRRYWLMFPREYPRGVFKFRTLVEAQAARDRMTRERRGSSG